MKQTFVPLGKIVVSYKGHGRTRTVLMEKPQAAGAFVAPTVTSQLATSQPLPAIQASPRMGKIGSGCGGHRQTFTYGDQTVAIH